MKLKVENRYLRILKANTEELNFIQSYFIRRPKNYRFMPAYKKGTWDGTINFIKGGRNIPIGFWREVLNICRSQNFKLEIEGREQLMETKISKEEFFGWLDYVYEGLDKKPYSYQREAAWAIIRNKGCVAELATGAGKTFIIFLIITLLMEKDYASRFLLIVPSVSLVEQMRADFKDYLSWSDKFTVKHKVNGIYSKSKYDPESDVVVGTYQSLVKLDKEFFDAFDVIACDETHTAKAASIQTILLKCKAQRRFGMTGTLPKSNTVDYLNVISNLGPSVYKIEAHELQGLKTLSRLDIRRIKLKYKDEEFCQDLHNLVKSGIENTKVLHLETEAITQSKLRIEFISKIFTKLKGNTLVLFKHINYGNALLNYFKSNVDDWQFYFVDGSIDSDSRSAIFEEMEEGKNRCLVASFGTLSTGVSINNIHNIIFVESYKSDVTVRQSIGRGLRLHKDKTCLTVIDIIDDFRTSTGHQNFTYKHGEERMRIYDEQKYPYKTYQINLI